MIPQPCSFLQWGLNLGCTHDRQGMDIFLAYFLSVLILTTWSKARVFTWQEG